jgi:hypothetical protein
VGRTHRAGSLPVDGLLTSTSDMRSSALRRGFDLPFQRRGRGRPAAGRPPRTRSTGTRSPSAPCTSAKAGELIAFSHRRNRLAAVPRGRGHLLESCPTCRAMRNGGPTPYPRPSTSSPALPRPTGIRPEQIHRLHRFELPCPARYDTLQHFGDEPRGLVASHACTPFATSNRQAARVPPDRTPSDTVLTARHFVRFPTDLDVGESLVHRADCSSWLSDPPRPWSVRSTA